MSLRRRSITYSGRPPTIDFMYNAFQDPDGETLSFSSVPFGTAYAGRLIVVGCEYGCSVNSGHNITATIGGVPATRIVNRAVTNTGACIFTAQPSGTSGAIFINLGDADFLSGGVGVWAINFIRSSSPVATSSDIAHNPLSLGLTVSAQGVGCAIAAVSTISATNFSWSGATENFDASFSKHPSQGSYSGASFTSASSGSRSIIASSNQTGNIAGCSASFR